MARISSQNIEHLLTCAFVFWNFVTYGQQQSENIEEDSKTKNPYPLNGIQSLYCEIVTASSSVWPGWDTFQCPPVSHLVAILLRLSWHFILCVQVTLFH